MNNLQGNLRANLAAWSKLFSERIRSPNQWPLSYLQGLLMEWNLPKSKQRNCRPLNSINNRANVFRQTKINVRRFIVTNCHAERTLGLNEITGKCMYSRYLLRQVLLVEDGVLRCGIIQVDIFPDVNFLRLIANKLVSNLNLLCDQFASLNLKLPTNSSKFRYIVIQKVPDFA